MEKEPENPKKKEKTVGAASVELTNKTKEKYDAVELQREMQKDYVDDLIKAAKSVDWDEPYYVCVQCRKERHMANVVRNQFYARKTRPIADYDLTLYSYDPKTGDLKFEWTVPDPDTCLYLLHNADTLPKDHQELIYMLKQFSEGQLI